jgi:hypothetical protein
MKLVELEALPREERAALMMKIVRVVWGAEQLLQSFEGVVGSRPEADARKELSEALHDLGFTRGVTPDVRGKEQ